MLEELPVDNDGEKLETSNDWLAHTKIVHHPIQRTKAL